MSSLCIGIIAVIALISGTFVRSVYLQMERMNNYTSPAQLHRNLYDLLKAGYDGAYFILEHEESRKFIQVRKYVDVNTFGIELAIPILEWSREFAKSVKILAEEKGLSVYSSDGSVAGVEFIYVDFNQDIDCAANFCRAVLRDVFHLSENDKYLANHVGLGSGMSFPRIADHPKGYEFTDRHTS